MSGVALSVSRLTGQTKFYQEMTPDPFCFTMGGIPTLARHLNHRRAASLGFQRLSQPTLCGLQSAQERRFRL